MENQACIFCKIINHEIPSSIITENNDFLVIKDIYPQAPIHYLILPKRHIINVKECTSQDVSLLGNMLLLTKELSKDLSAPQDYRIMLNNGYSSGQRVFHMHLHFLAGKQMSE